ncbi:DUF4394 domain-containing protein, partial [Hymenobacter agri]
MYTRLLSRPAAGRRPRRYLRVALSILLVLLVSLAAQAQTTIIGLGTLTQNVAPGNIIFPPGGNAGDQGLAFFDPVSGSPNANLQRITGLTGNQKLVGLDFRPLTGQLYALGYDPALASNNAQLYTLDPKTGVATPVSGAPISLALGGATERIGFNFNPVADLARVVSSNDANYRLSPVTGDVPSPGTADGPLAYAAGDPNFGLDPRVSGVAYTNAFRGATTTTLYDVDVRNDASAPPGILSIQNLPNAGTLNTAAPITLSGFGILPEARLNLDIFYTGTTNKAYLLELTKPNSGGYSSSNIYDFDLTTGAATNKRNVVPALAFTPFNLLAITVAPTPTITSLSPPSAEVGTPGLTLTVNGTGFVNGTTVQFNGSDRTTTYVSATQLTAALTTADLATVGSYNVTVTNPPFPGVASTPATFLVTQPCAAPTNLATSNITSTSATVSFTGNNSATSYTLTTSPATTTQTLPATATSATLMGLTPNTAYTVSITTTCPSGTTAPATITFTTSVAAATLAVSQGGTSYPSGGTAYSFGNQTINTTSAPVTFTLTNGGTDPLTIGSITTTGNFAVSGTAPTTVPAGGTATVSVTFTPTATGTATGTLVINSNATNAATYTVNLTGNGQAAVPNPQIAVSQSGSGIANGSTFFGFATTQLGSTSAPVTFTISNSSATDVLTLGAFTFSGPFALSGTAPTSVAPNSSATFSVVFTPTAAGTNTGSVRIANNSQTNSPYVINFSGQGTPQDLVVSTAQNVQGSYRNVTVTGTGVATLSGTLLVSGTLTVTGALVTNCQTVIGGGNFVLEAGAQITICDANGITLSGPTGSIQVTGTRSYSPDAIYSYRTTVPQAQVTGNGLPAQIRFLRLDNAGGLSLSQPLSVSRLLTLFNGNLNTNGQMLTLLSSAAGTASIDNTGGAVVGTATVQRYIDPSLNAGLGYRHYSSPVANTTVADLSTSNYSPVVNPLYNTVGSSATPFPTVFSYDETRVTTSGNPGTLDFDKGYVSPNTVGDPLQATLGYTVNIASTETVDFVGTLNNGPLTASNLTRGTQATSGYHLRGNPYPSPLDWQLMTDNGRLTGIDRALYVFKSSGQYSGSYSSYNNGVSVNGGTQYLALGQGFFVRTSTPGTAGSIAFTNRERVTLPINSVYQRSTADTRTQLLLSLRNGPVANQTAIYFDGIATPGFDSAADAYAIASTNGLVLATELPASTETLSINGQPLLTGADVLVAGNFV